MDDSKDNPGTLGNPGFVTEKFCDERFGRIVDKLDEMKSLLQEIKNDKKKESHFIRNFAGTLIGGGLVAYFAWLLSTFVH